MNQTASHAIQTMTKGIRTDKLSNLAKSMLAFTRRRDGAERVAAHHQGQDGYESLELDDGQRA